MPRQPTATVTAVATPTEAREASTAELRTLMTHIKEAAQFPIVHGIMDKMCEAGGWDEVYSAMPQRTDEEKNSKWLAFCELATLMWDGVEGTTLSRATITLISHVDGDGAPVLVRMPSVHRTEPFGDYINRVSGLHVHDTLCVLTPAANGMCGNVLHGDGIKREIAYTIAGVEIPTTPIRIGHIRSVNDLSFQNTPLVGVPTAWLEGWLRDNPEWAVDEYTKYLTRKTAMNEAICRYDYGVPVMVNTYMSVDYTGSNGETKTVTQGYAQQEGYRCSSCENYFHSNHMADNEERCQDCEDNYEYDSGESDEDDNEPATPAPGSNGRGRVGNSCPQHVYEGLRCGCNDTTLSAGMRHNDKPITFGLELETSESGNPEITHKTALPYNVQTDGSISGMEYVTGILSGDKGFQTLEQIVNELNESGARVSSGDTHPGMHVHIGIPDVETHTLANMVRLALQCQDDVYLYVNKHRRGNSYCKKFQPITAQSFKTKNVFERLATNHRMMDEVILHALDSRACHPGEYNTYPVYRHTNRGSKYDGPRTLWLNISNAFFLQPQHCHRPAVEFRLHHGTLEYELMYYWLLFCQAFTKYASDPAHDGALSGAFVPALYAGSSQTVPSWFHITKNHPVTLNEILEYGLKDDEALLKKALAHFKERKKRYA